MRLDGSSIENPDAINEGFKNVTPGAGMAMVSRFSAYTGHKGAHELDLEIVAWPNAEDVGQVHKELIHTGGTKQWDVRRLTCLAIATGLITPDYVKQCNAEKVDVEFDESQLEGRPLFIELHLEQGQNTAKEFLKIANAGLAFYRLDDPRCKEWPRNQGLYAQWVGKLPKMEFTTKAGATSASQSRPDANGSAGGRPAAAASESAASANPFAK